MAMTPAAVVSGRPGARSAAGAPGLTSLADRPPFGRAIAAGPDMRIVQVEGRALRPDPRYGGEIVPRRRAGRGPLQRVRKSPRVIRGDPLPVLGRRVDVVQEDQRG